MNELTSLPKPDRDRTLQEAYHSLEDGVRTGGPDGKIDEWSIYDESFRRLVDWAEKCGCFFEGLQPIKSGGREHDLSFVEDGSYWLKFTKPAQAGYVVTFDRGVPGLLPAVPTDYLARLILQNQLFADHISFVGVGGERLNPRIITRQAHLQGTAASHELITSMMVDQLGFQELPRSYYVGYAESLSFLRDDIAVFDLRPANVVHTDDGLVVPIDAIPTRLDAEWQTRLHQAANSR